MVLKTRWNSVAEKLKQPTGLLKSTDLLLTDLLAKILKKTGITVMAVAIGPKILRRARDPHRVSGRARHLYDSMASVAKLFA